MDEHPASSIALREALLEHCRLAGWTPQHLGHPDQTPGLEEVLLEIIASREAEATRLSLELIERCEQLGWSSPWLQDNRARCLVHQGRDQEAIAIWQQLLGAEDPAAAAIAEDTLAALHRRPAAAVKANRIRQLREENRPEQWKPLLLQALLTHGSDPAGALEDVIAAAAVDQPLPYGTPWDPAFLRQELLLELYEQQLNRLEEQLR
jgi:hypothetical protein